MKASKTTAERAEEIITEMREHFRRAKGPYGAFRVAAHHIAVLEGLVHELIRMQAGGTREDRPRKDDPEGWRND